MGIAPSAPDKRRRHCSLLHGQPRALPAHRTHRHGLASTCWDRFLAVLAPPGIARTIFLASQQIDKMLSISANFDAQAQHAGLARGAVDRIY